MASHSGSTPTPNSVVVTFSGLVRFWGRYGQGAGEERREAVLRDRWTEVAWLGEPWSVMDTKRIFTLSLNLVVGVKGPLFRLSVAHSEGCHGDIPRHAVNWMGVCSGAYSRED
eukprot:6201165-Amphidinium_carterae.1